MKKIFSLIFLLFLLVIITGCNKQTSITQNNNLTKTNNINNYSMSSAEQVAEKLEIYYFHRTARCYSCKIIGQYTREVIEQKYSEQLKNGAIDFRELNVELSENKEIAKKYQASGSSLFINRIINNGDNIEQDTNVWRLLNNENQFKDYLENKINFYLGM